jgi:hypothetical protein
MSRALYEAVKSGRVKLTDLNDAGKQALREYMGIKVEPPDLSSYSGGMGDLRKIESDEAAEKQKQADLMRQQLSLASTLNPMPYVDRAYEKAKRQEMAARPQVLTAKPPEMKNPFLRAFDIGADALVRDATLGLSDKIERGLDKLLPGTKVPQTTPRTGFEKGVATAGELGGALLPIGATFKLAELGTRTVGRALPKVASRIPEKVARLGNVGIAGGAYEGSRAAIEGEPLPEVAKSAAEGAVLWPAMDLGLGLAAKGISKGAQYAGRKLLPDVKMGDVTAGRDLPMELPRAEPRRIPVRSELPRGESLVPKLPEVKPAEPPALSLDAQRGAPTKKGINIPIDERSFEEVANPKVKAYSWENPELKPFIQGEAKRLLNELSYTVKGEKVFIRDQEGYLSGVSGQKRITDPAIARIKDELGVTYAEIREALERLIHNQGLENQALAKKIELVIDDNLSAGYRSVDGREVPANDMYLSAKKFIGDLEKSVQEEAVASKLLPKLPKGMGARSFEIPGKQSDVQGFKTRSFATTAMESEKVKPNVKSGILQETQYPGGQGTYKTRSLEETDFMGREIVEANPANALNRALSETEDYDLITSIGVNLAEHFQRVGTYEADAMATDVLLTLAEKLTSMGRGINAAKLLTKTPEGAVVKGGRIVKKSQEEIFKKNPKLKAEHEAKTKEVADAMGKANRETVEEVLKQTPELTTKKVKPKDPDDQLAKKINDYLVEPEPAVLTPEALEKKQIREIINSLFNIAKEVLPEQEARAAAKDPMELIYKMLRDKNKAAEIWEKAKSTIKQLRILDPELGIQNLDDFLNFYIGTPYAMRQLEKGINAKLKGWGVNLSDAIASQNVGKLKGRLVEELSRGNRQLGQEIDQAINLMVGRQRDKLESSLAKKIMDMTKSKSPKEASPAQEMTRLLLQKVRELMPKTKATPKTALELFEKAMQSDVEKKAYADIWAGIKRELDSQAASLGKERGYDDPIIQALDQFFNLPLKNEFPSKMVESVVKQGIKDQGIDLASLVRQYYTKSETAKVNLVDWLVRNTSLSPEEVRRVIGPFQEKFNQLASTKKEQILNQIFKERAKPQQKAINQRIIEWSNLGALDTAAYRRLVAEKLKLPVLTDADAKALREIAGRVQKTKGREQDIAIGQLEAKLASLTAPTKGKTVSTIQTMAQLLNPKTAIRNLGGNFSFGLLENVSDVVGTSIDLPLSLLTKQRSKVLPSLPTQLKGGKAGFKLGLEDALLGIDTSAMKGTKFDLPSGRVFRGKVMGGLEKALNIELRATDRAFYQAAYDESLRQQMKAAGKDVADEAMHEIAHHDALYRTFQDENALSNLFVGLKRLLNKPTGGDFGLGDFVLKYPKTPANLLARGLEYSPAGFFKVIAESSKPLMGRGFNQKAFVEAFSRSLVGTAGLVGTGALLHKVGIITGKPHPDFDIAELHREVGFGEYRLNVDALKRFMMGGFNPNDAKPQKGDRIVSYDWNQPSAISLAMGADIDANRGQAKGITGTLMKSVGDIPSELLNAVFTGINTMAEQPVMQGVQTLVSGGEQDAARGILKTMAGVPSSFIPTVLSQIKQLVDNQRRETYDPNIVQESLNRAANKIPGMAGKLPQKYGVLGQPLETYQGGTNQWWNVFLNPAFVSKYTPSPEAQLAIDVFINTGETSQVPRVVDKYFMVGGKKVTLSGAERSELQRIVGEETQKGFAKINPGLTEQARLKAMGDVLTKAGQKGRKAILDGRGIRSSITNQGLKATKQDLSLLP